MQGLLLLRVYSPDKPTFLTEFKIVCVVSFLVLSEYGNVFLRQSNFEVFTAPF